MAILFDLNALKTFSLVAQDLNFTAVAEKRNTVQSAVSAQIKKLEESLGQLLLVRGRGQAMSLTREGEAFLVYANRILALSQEAVETVRTAKSRQIVRLGTTVTLAMSIVSDVLKDFAVQHPNVQIQIQCDRSDNLLRRLENGEIDVAFMLDQGRHSLRKFVHSMALEWVCSRAFQMPLAEPIPLAFLTDGRDLRQYALNALDSAGRVGNVTHLSAHPIGVRSLVQAGLALTVMPRKTISEPLIPVGKEVGLPELAPVALAVYHAPREGLFCADLLVSQLKSASQ